MAKQKRIAIVQSCYIPWKGYFDLIGLVDEFVLFEDVQYVKRHWHNRNKIKTPQGTQWLTIPVESKGKYFQTIANTKISGRWAQKHWQIIEQNYRRAPFFKHFEERVKYLFSKADEMSFVSEVNFLFLSEFSKMLNIETIFSLSSVYRADGKKTDRLLSICQEAGATHYLSGPAAKAYFEESKFKAAGIAVEWMDYSGYPEYHQVFDPFEHGVSIIDLLFNCGPHASQYMKFGRK